MLDYPTQVLEFQTTLKTPFQTVDYHAKEKDI
jgi:hypothetical protein